MLTKHIQVTVFTLHANTYFTLSFLKQSVRSVRSVRSERSERSERKEKKERKTTC